LQKPPPVPGAANSGPVSPQPHPQTSRAPAEQPPAESARGDQRQPRQPAPPDPETAAPIRGGGGFNLATVVPALGMLGVIGGATFGIVWLLSEPMPEEKREKPKAVSAPPPLQVADGAGRNPGQPSGTRGEVEVPGEPKPAPSDGKRQAEALLDEALRKIGVGAFSEADRLAQEAIALEPQSLRAKGIWCLGAYAQKYLARADEAIDALDDSCVINFGGQYGQATFVERHGDDFTFQCNGENVTFSLAQLNSIDGVRFRIAARWLDGDGSAANHLILGSILYVKKLDDAGRFLGSRGPWKAAARSRWRKALEAADAPADVRQHAEWLLGLTEG